MSLSTSCNYPSKTCPVEATAYGYIPNLGANILFTAIFGLALIAHILILVRPPRYQGGPQRNWVFSIFALVGTTLSFLGSLSRIWLNSDVWLRAALAVELICNIVAPAVLVGALYLVPKYLVLQFGPHHSRVPVTWFPWSFLCCDAVSIVFLVVGGGVATAKGTGSDSSTGPTGGDVILTGVILQVATMLGLLGLLADYVSRRRRGQQTDSGEGVMMETEVASEILEIPEQRAASGGRRLQFFVGCMTLAYVTVLARCIYRIAEFASGWGNAVMRNEPAFLVMDSAMIALAWACLTVGHPAFLFPEMCMQLSNNK